MIISSPLARALPRSSIREVMPASAVNLRPKAESFMTASSGIRWWWRRLRPWLIIREGDAKVTDAVIGGQRLKAVDIVVLGHPLPFQAEDQFPLEHFVLFHKRMTVEVAHQLVLFQPFAFGESNKVHHCPGGDTRRLQRPVLRRI